MRIIPFIFAVVVCGVLSFIDLCLAADVQALSGSVADIQQAIVAEDAASLQRLAHRMKGSLRVFGAQQASDLAFRIETMASENRVRQTTHVMGELIETLSCLQSDLETIITEKQACES